LKQPAAFVLRVEEMEGVACFLQTDSTYQSAQCHIPNDHNFHIHCHENFRYNTENRDCEQLQ
jgi:hypothetical protein